MRPRPGSQRLRQLPGTRGLGWTRPARRPAVGLPAGRSAGLAVLRGRQPGAGRRQPRPRSLPSRGGPGCRAAAARRSSGRPRPSCELWELLRAVLGPAREIRASAAGDGHLRPAAGARPTRWCAGSGPDELDILLPASVAMFTEEVGVSPVGPDGGARLPGPGAELIGMGRAFARIEDGQVVFKAEIGAVTPHACQVQGVWVRPDLRGRGLAAAGHGRGGHRGAARRRAGGVAVRQRLQRPGPGRLPAGRASPRPPPSPPSCSEPARPGGPIGGTRVRRGQGGDRLR